MIDAVVALMAFYVWCCRGAVEGIRWTWRWLVARGRR